MAAKGEFAQIKQHLEHALKRRVDWVGDHDIYAMLADGAAVQQDLADLKRYAPLAEETAARFDHKLYRASAHRAWGVLHRLSSEIDEAESRLNLSMKLLQEMDARWQMGRTAVELGRVAVVRADTQRARSHFSKAVSLFSELGASPDAERARQELAALS